MLQLLNQPGAERSDVIDFISMVRFPATRAPDFHKSGHWKAIIPFTENGKAAQETVENISKR